MRTAAAAPAQVQQPSNDLSSVIQFYGNEAASLTGNIVGLREGKVSIDTGTNPYTRSYNQTTQGPLRFRHGSQVPASTVFGDADRAAMQSQSPGKALDAMAKVMGANVGFDAMANSPAYYNPAEAAWMGNCAGWSYSANSKAVSKAVDVDGAEGQKGAWFAGQFLSRADLGDWAMAVANPFASAQLERPNTQSVSNPKPLDVLYALTALRKDGPGLVADVWNDGDHGTHQVWNQPIHGAEVEVAKVPDSVKEELFALAKKDGWNGSDIKLVRTKMIYGREKTDGWEDKPYDESKNFNMYVMTNSLGEARWAIAADDPRLKDIEGLPEKSSDPMPDYINLMPTDLIDDVMAGRQIGFDNVPHKKEFEFYMGKVLPNAVPAYVRTQFERELRDAVSLTQDDRDQLAVKYPKIANAYSPEQWKAFQDKLGLDPDQFGAVWPH